MFFSLAVLLGSLADVYWYFLLLPSFILLFYPRLFRIPYFAQTKELSTRKARQYALHCSLVVIPQFFGVIRYIYGSMSNRPLENTITGQPKKTDDNSS